MEKLFLIGTTDEDGRQLFPVAIVKAETREKALTKGFRKKLLNKGDGGYNDARETNVKNIEGRLKALKNELNIYSNIL